MYDDARAFLREMLEMTSGPIVWFAHLVLVYGATSLGCSRQGEATLIGSEIVTGVTIASTFLALGGTGWLIARHVRELAGQGGGSEARSFVDRVTIALGVFAVIGIVWTALPALLGPTCPS